MNKFKRGDKVICNGNKESIVLDIYDKKLDMYEVRLWSGFRHIGDVVMSGSELISFQDNTLSIIKEQ